LIRLHGRIVTLSTRISTHFPRVQIRIHLQELLPRISNISGVYLRTRFAHTIAQRPTNQGRRYESGFRDLTPIDRPFSSLELYAHVVNLWAMRNGVIASVIVAVLLVGAGAGFLAGSSVAGNRAGKSSSTTSANSSITCSVPDEGQVLLHIMNSTSGKPVASAPVQGKLLLEACTPNAYTEVDLNPVLTNATGFVTFSGELGEYWLHFPTFGNHFVGVSMNPAETAFVTLYVPGGETNITYSGFLGSSCPAGL